MMTNIDLPENCPLLKYVETQRGGFQVLRGVLIGEAATICQNCGRVSIDEPLLQKAGDKVMLQTLPNSDCL